MKVQKIVSGGQTGVDRAAFDFGLENGIEIGGFIPKNRLAEDGKISMKYSNLTETESEDYSERTELNVVNSDATVIISRGKLVGGSLLTKKLCQKHFKACLHIDLKTATAENAGMLASAWIASMDCGILNIAGSRASRDPEIYSLTKEFLSFLID